MQTIYLVVIISILGPVIGSVLGVMKRMPVSYVCNMLYFAAGVMLSISFLELIPTSIGLSSPVVCALGVLIGSLFMYGLDKAIPHIHPEFCSQEQGKTLERTAYYLIIGIFMHNFPEGMAIAAGEIVNTKAGFTIALAIAVHNIPEGICTSSPYYNLTGQRLRSFLVSSSTAIPIVAGFLIARFVFIDIPDVALGLIVSATAGLMIYISGDELIPFSYEAGGSHSTIFSMMAGVIFVVLLDMI